MSRILVINGPNLNMLGKREADIYGGSSLDDVEQMLAEELSRWQQEPASTGRRSATALTFFQSNHEGAIIDRIHQTRSDAGRADGILINPGGLTHTSVALRDALAAVALPFIEVHISNVYAREPFRKHSFISDIASGIIAGLGVKGYRLALQAMIDLIEEKRL